MSHRPIQIAIALAVISAALGCSHRVRVLNPRVERSPVVYESDRAQSAFERALMERYARGEAEIGNTSMLSVNAFFNREIHVADENLDGIISDSEAQRYLTTIGQ